MLRRRCEARRSGVGRQRKEKVLGRLRDGDTKQEERRQRPGKEKLGGGRVTAPRTERDGAVRRREESWCLGGGAGRTSETSGGCRGVVGLGRRRREGISGGRGRRSGAWWAVLTGRGDEGTSDGRRGLVRSGWRRREGCSGNRRERAGMAGGRICSGRHRRGGDSGRRGGVGVREGIGGIEILAGVVAKGE